LANQLSFKVSGVAEATGALRAAIALGQQRGLEKIGLRGVQLVAMHAPVGATGNLQGGIFAEFHNDAPLMHEVISVEPPADVYAAAVEEGTRPHMPPSSALLLWVKQKLHVSEEKQAMSIAFLIARAIAKRGTKAIHMFDQAIKQLQIEGSPILELEIAQALHDAGFWGGNF
jgi:hypothetical protein